MGGAAVMTPVLVFLGLTPSAAVGVDLLWASITKTVGGFAHIRLGTVKWSVIGYLALGSIPGALLGVGLLVRWREAYSVVVVEGWLQLALGWVVIFVSLFLFAKLFFRQFFSCPHELKKWPSRILTVTLGFVTGVIVATTSVGSGTLVALFLLLVCPLGACRVVGTDIVHAVILTAVAGLGHLLILDTIDWPVLWWLLAGSIPGVFIGSHLSLRINTNVLSAILAVVLLVAGVGLLV